MIFIKELFLYHIIKHKSLYLDIKDNNIIIKNNDINIKINLNNITALNRKTIYNNTSYEFITLELKNSEFVNYNINNTNNNIITNIKKVSKINTISFSISTKDINKLYYFDNKCILDNIKDYNNPNNQIVPYWGFLFNYNQRKLIQYMLLLFNFFYFMWSVYQLIYLFPNLYLSFKSNLMYYFGDYAINIFNIFNINGILLKIDYIIKIFKLDGFKELINGLLFLLYPLKLLYIFTINVYNNIFINIYNSVLVLIYYIKYIINLLNIFKLSNQKKNIINISNIYYQNPKLILNMLDYITKPFRILYILINLLGTSLKTSYEIIKQKYYYKINFKIKNNINNNNYDKYNL